jgi:hypothetical protein
MSGRNCKLWKSFASHWEKSLVFMVPLKKHLHQQKVASSHHIWFYLTFLKHRVVSMHMWCVGSFTLSAPWFNFYSWCWPVIGDKSIQQEHSVVLKSTGKGNSFEWRHCKSQKEAYLWMFKTFLSCQLERYIIIRL